MDGYCVECMRTLSLHSHAVRVLGQFVGRNSVVGSGEGAFPMLSYASVLFWGRGLVGVSTALGYALVWGVAGASVAGGGGISSTSSCRVVGALGRCDEVGCLSILCWACLCCVYCMCME